MSDAHVMRTAFTCLRQWIMEGTTQKDSPEHEDSDDKDSPPQLSAHALAALQEFYAEEAVLQQQLALGKGAAPKLITEDWQLSQFWYDEATAQLLAEEAVRASHNKRIACISCPTLFAKLLEIKPQDVDVILLEYDKRFEIYGDLFCYYDYNKPLDLPIRLVTHSFGLVVADPPFLSEECLIKIAETVKYLTNDKIILCTGAVMETLALEVLNVSVYTTFVPRHARNLANEFRCYSNYKTCLDPPNRIETKTQKELPSN